jgi:hypothetical protein
LRTQSSAAPKSPHPSAATKPATKLTQLKLPTISKPPVAKPRTMHSTQPFVPKLIQSKLPYLASEMPTAKSTQASTRELGANDTFYPDGLDEDEFLDVDMDMRAIADRDQPLRPKKDLKVRRKGRSGAKRRRESTPSSDEDLLAPSQKWKMLSVTKLKPLSVAINDTSTRTTRARTTATSKHQKSNDDDNDPTFEDDSEDMPIDPTKRRIRTATASVGVLDSTNSPEDRLKRVMCAFPSFEQNQIQILYGAPLPNIYIDEKMVA